MVDMMSWSIRIFFALFVLGLLFLLLQPPSKPQATSIGVVPTTIGGSADEVAPAHRVPVAANRITVYQAQGKQGEAVFSDRFDQGQARVVDHHNGTTYHSAYSASVGGHVPNSASVSYNAPNTEAHAALSPVESLKQQSQQMAQQTADLRRAQIDRVVDR